MLVPNETPVTKGLIKRSANNSNDDNDNDDDDKILAMGSYSLTETWHLAGNQKTKNKKK